MMSTAAARRVVQQVAEEYHLDLATIISKTRTDATVRARAEVARRLAAGGMTTPQIGSILHRHHTMVVYYLGKREKKLSEKLTKMGWRKPRVSDISPPPSPPSPPPPSPPRRCLVPYAGAELGGRYQWKPLERRT